MAVKRWNGTAWVVQSGNANAIKYQATAPANPVTGDVWVKSDVDTPSVDASVYYRWRKTMTGGETSLSGLDDNSLSLSYTPSYEQLFINGVLQVRNVDYTPASSTSVTGLTALVAGDVVEIMSPNVYSVSNVYTQATSDAKYATNARTGMSLVVPTSVSVGSGSFALSSNGQLTFTGASSVSLNGCFTSAYDNYKITFDTTASVGTDSALSLRYRSSGSDISTSTYVNQRIVGFSTTIITSANVTGTDRHPLSFVHSTRADLYYAAIELKNPFLARKKLFRAEIHVPDSNPTYYIESHAGWNTTSTSCDGFSIFTAGTSISGTIRVYGYNNGA
jgi:hypothetical protein